MLAQASAVPKGQAVIVRLDMPAWHLQQRTSRHDRDTQPARAEAPGGVHWITLENGGARPRAAPRAGGWRRPAATAGHARWVACCGVRGGFGGPCKPRANGGHELAEPY
jgi:hypothetical protein